MAEMTGLSHRLRGHKIREERHEVNMNRPWDIGYGVQIEAGRIVPLLVCSCGKRWLRVLVNPLRNEWRWVS